MVLSVFAAVLLASASVATPVAREGSILSLPFEKRINTANLRGLVQHDQARAKALIESRSAGKNKKRAGSGNVPATNEAVSYVASVGIGSPATNFDLIIDTGSSNTWAGSRAKPKITSTTKQTGLLVSVQYGSGSFSGVEILDQVTLSSSLVIKQQSIGRAIMSTGFSTVDGIVGIGPVDLTEGTLELGLDDATIPTVTDNLFSQGTISENLVAVSFNPITSEPVTNGELTFGGTDSSKFTGDITFTPITQTSPASEFWGIDQTITFNGATLLQSSGIVDTGTTLVLIATDAFAKYQSATGGTIDNTTGLISFTEAQVSALQPLNFVVSGVTFALSPNAQLWPRSLDTDIGGTAGQNLGIVNDIGSDSGSGLDFINGQTFLERFYSVFDTANKQVGFATTPNTDATTN